MIRKLRTFFLTRTLREKLLVVVLLLGAIGYWALEVGERGQRWWRRMAMTNTQIKDQDRWLSQRSDIEAITHAAASQMDPAKTLDPVALSVAVRQMATDSGLRDYRSSQVTQAMSSGRFSVNVLRVNVSRADWRAFAQFYQRVQERAPYIAITDLALNPVAGNPALVQGALTIASFEARH